MILAKVDIGYLAVSTFTIYTCDLLKLTEREIKPINQYMREIGLIKRDIHVLCTLILGI
jgi:hypothetical protein